MKTGETNAGARILPDAARERESDVALCNMYMPEGVKNIWLDSNEISGNNTDNWELRAAGLRLYRRRLRQP